MGRRSSRSHGSTPLMVGMLLSTTMVVRRLRTVLRLADATFAGMFFGRVDRMKGTVGQGDPRPQPRAR